MYTEITSVPADVKRFDTLKIGDKITGEVLREHRAAAEAAGRAVNRHRLRGPHAGPRREAGGTAATQRTITATITNIDPKVPSITFSGPNGWTYSSRVEDKAALAKVKVGDCVDITWTMAVLISVDAPK